MGSQNKAAKTSSLKLEVQEMSHPFGTLVVLLRTSVKQVIFRPSSAFTTLKTTKSASVSIGA